jgi:hypothetical protein
VGDKELGSTALNGLGPYSKSFVQGVCVHGKPPNYKKNCDNLEQEEIKLESYPMQRKEVEDLALIGRTRKGSKKG